MDAIGPEGREGFSEKLSERLILHKRQLPLPCPGVLHNPDAYYLAYYGGSDLLKESTAALVLFTWSSIKSVALQRSVHQLYCRWHLAACCLACSPSHSSNLTTPHQAVPKHAFSRIENP